MSNVRIKQQGAVALFIVVFAALLITTITVAFVRIMAQNQDQASTIDLSKSALDSAFAGVEDAKRAIIECENSSSPDTNLACLALNRPENCETIQDAQLVDETDGEVLIKREEGDNELDQAYTCVKVTNKASNYRHKLESTASRLVPLRGVGTFDKIVIEWFSQANLRASGASTVNPLPAGTETLSAGNNLPPFDSPLWPDERPPMIRAQLIQFDGDSFNLSDFNKNEHNATLFLMPDIAGSDLEFADDIRRKPLQKGPKSVVCHTTFSSGIYACSAEIAVQSPINPSSDQEAYLLISQIYGDDDVDFSVTLYNGEPGSENPPVKFDSVQYVVDSTGRANDLFRRVESRVELGGITTPFPEATVDLTGGAGARGFCKMLILEDTGGYTNAC